MNLGRRHASMTVLLLAFFYMVSGSAAAAPSADRYYHDRCRSAFAETPEAKAQADKDRPLVMAVFGDSIMWGQGLKERDKFWCRVKQWVELKTRRHLKEKVYAHAGAIIEEGSLTEGDHEIVLNIHEQGGEVNVSFPTINQQVERAAKEFRVTGQDVDLVLVDGCINDVNIRNLLNAEKTEPEIEYITRDRCGKPMERLLTRIATEFPNAYVLVIGYYPIIYEGLAVEEGGKKKKVMKGSANNQLTKLAFKMLGGRRVSRAECEKNLNVCLGPLSRVWYETSSKVLGEIVEIVNRGLGGKRSRVHFAEMNFPPEYGFSTKQSMLWNIRFGATNVGGLRKWVAVGLDLFRVIDTNDDRWDERGRQCRATARAFKTRLKQLSQDGKITSPQKADLQQRLKYFEFVCRRGSLGHPNRFGAALYAQAVIGRLEAILPETGWVTTPVREHAPEESKQTSED